MNQSAEERLQKPLENEPYVKTATVEEKINGRFIVNFTGGKREAKQAFSCLVTPEVNDRVLCIEDGEAAWHILGIIERPTNTGMNLSFQGNTCIGVNTGTLDIHSKEQLTLSSENISCISHKSVHKSQEMFLASNSITASGKELHAAFTTVRLISNLINTMARQVIDKFKGYIRHTEAGDMVKAGQITRCTKGLYALDSKYTIMNSQHSTKIDGEKILMG